MLKKSARKPPPPGPGRPKGSKNKTTAILKDAILMAAEQAGNRVGKEGLVSYLEAQAVENPGPFMALLGKVLPLTLSGDPDNPMPIVPVLNVTIGGTGSSSSSEAG